jgi:hypothetical protein
MNDTLTESQWQTAHKIAVEFVKEQQRIEPNKEGISAELDKIISYFCTFANKLDSGNKFFKYVKELVKNGKQIGHSGKTPEYYRIIDQSCDQYLRGYQDNPQAMLQILGWVSRLMRYYKTVPVAELDAKLLEKAAMPETQTQRRAEMKASVTKTFEVGDITEAKVISKKDKGKEVTYEIMGTSIRRNNKEPKKFETLSIDQVVKVEIVEIDDGIPKKFKRVD